MTPPVADANAARLIADYGEQAYWQAVRLTVAAQFIGDKDGAEMFAAAARALLVAGYHKYPEQPLVNPSTPATIDPAPP